LQNRQQSMSTAPMSDKHHKPMHHHKKPDAQ